MRLSDETLAPRAFKSFTAEEDISLILIPLVGSITYGSNSANEVCVFPEELQIINLKKGNTFRITNKNEDALVNYLQIWVKMDLVPEKIIFDTYSHNQLNIVYGKKHVNILFGVFDGRREGFFTTSEQKNTLLTFVINGAFEVQNRLLESRDSLILSQTRLLELEALSENAIVLILEENN
ncbi:hypothetical protein [Flagellimonas olearia]|uniref:pirin family protein n=1 Tax=Flagellimonas olearia TaxID=552546 RepID=UPI0012620B16|nr:hypothetical protein [Allomuricauda olearia]